MTIINHAVDNELLRDIFAAIAIHVILSNMANLKHGVGLGESAYRAADAMMAHRQKKDEPKGEDAA